jgi:hypothetical protein
MDKNVLKTIVEIFENPICQTFKLCTSITKWFCSLKLIYFNCPLKMIVPYDTYMETLLNHYLPNNNVWVKIWPLMHQK